MYKQRILSLFMLAAILSFIFVMVNSNVFINDDDAEVTYIAKASLKETIQERAEQYEEVAEDAYIDRVWKKTPGRNGKKVNIEKSYDNMKKGKSFTPSLLVFDEVAPKVSLKDLPPAPVYRGHPNKNMVALMINVSWGEEYIPSILKTLKNKNVKATFYIEGKWAKEHKKYVEMIVEEQHLIGNHAYNHPDMARISQTEMRMQIDKTNDIIAAITGKKPAWFAPPSGSFNQQVVEIADQLNMETILWTVDTIDWKNPPVSVMINRVMDNIHPGATVLMHPTEVIAEGLESLIDQLKEQGYDLGTIETLLSEKRG